MWERLPYIDGNNIRWALLFGTILYVHCSTGRPASKPARQPTGPPADPPAHQPAANPSTRSPNRPCANPSPITKPTHPTANRPTRQSILSPIHSSAIPPYPPVCHSTSPAPAHMADGKAFLFVRWHKGMNELPNCRANGGLLQIPD